MFFEKGYQFRVDIESVSEEDFAKTILALVNTKSSNNAECKITDIQTIAGTNLIIVTAETDIREWLEKLTGGEVEVGEKVIAYLNYEDVVDIKNSTVYIGKRELADELEDMYDVHVVGDNN